MLTQKQINKIHELADNPEYRYKRNFGRAKKGEVNYDKISEEVGCNRSAVRFHLDPKGGKKYVLQRFLQQKAIRSFRFLMRNIDIIEKTVSEEGKEACEIVYDGARKRSGDNESLFQDSEFVKAFVGTSCKRYEKIVEKEKTMNNFRSLIEYIDKIEEQLIS